MSGSSTLFQTMISVTYISPNDAKYDYVFSDKTPLDQFTNRIRTWHSLRGGCIKNEKSRTEVLQSVDGGEYIFVDSTVRVNNLDELFNSALPVFNRRMGVRFRPMIPPPTLTRVKRTLQSTNCIFRKQNFDVSCPVYYLSNDSMLLQRYHDTKGDFMFENFREVNSMVGLLLKDVAHLCAMSVAVKVDLLWFEDLRDWGHGYQPKRPYIWIRRSSTLDPIMFIQITEPSVEYDENSVSSVTEDPKTLRRLERLMVRQANKYNLSEVYGICTSFEEWNVLWMKGINPNDENRTSQTTSLLYGTGARRLSGSFDVVPLLVSALTKAYTEVYEKTNLE